MIYTVTKISLATVASIIAYAWIWWAPIITFPFVIIVLCFAYKPSSLVPSSALEELIFYLSPTGYVLSQIITFGKNIDGWYGWIIGGIVSFILGGITAGAHKDSRERIGK